MDESLILILSMLSTIFSSLSLISSMWYSYHRIKLERKKMEWRKEHPFPRMVEAIKTRKGVYIDLDAFEEEP